MKYNLKLFLNNFHGCSSGKIGENQIIDTFKRNTGLSLPTRWCNRH